MSGRKYLTFGEYNGSLGGLSANPAGSHDVASPGGLSTRDHHWSHGLFGKPEQVLDAYEGTGERYVYGIYGNLYTPGKHASLFDNYRGPHSDRTEYTTMLGEPYFWEDPSFSPPSNTAYSPINNPVTNGGNMVPFMAGSVKGSTTAGNFIPASAKLNIEGFKPNVEKSTDLTNIELIEPVEAPPKKSNRSDGIKGTFVGEQDNEFVKSLMSITLIVVAFIAIEFWGESLHNFTIQYLNKGATISWVRYTLYALLATIILILLKGSKPISDVVTNIKKL